MHLICPQCQNPMEFGETPAPEEVLCPSCGSSFKLERGATQAWSPPDGARRLGRFELLDAVGTGTFGTVYKARDPELGRIVAIKVPRAAHLATREDMDRFLREARSVAQLRHPGIVPVHEVGHADDVPYLVSDFVEGVTLDDQLTARRPAPREAAQLLAAVADALQYAHEQGVVHRDVKPSNIMLGADGVPRLMDFGLAKREAGEVTMTLDGQILGTPAYMSPEQAKGEAHRVDGRADVYSVGVILYQLLTGELPFRGNSRMLLHQVLHDDPRRPRSLNDRVPRDLETICLKALAKEPARRYASAGALADDLRRFLKGEPIHARPVGRWERGWIWARRRPAAAGLIAVLALVAVVGFPSALWLWRRAETARAEANELAGAERKARTERETDLYFHRIALAHRELTASSPSPGRAEELLDLCPQDLRGWEWHYLRRRWRIEPAILRDPGNKAVNSLAFNRAGDHLAAACGDSTVKVWNLKTRQVVATLKGHEGNVLSVAFSPDGKRLASASADKTVRVWDLATQQEIFPHLPGQEYHDYGMAYSVAFSPDGRWLATCSEPGTVKLWDVMTGQLVRELHDHEVKASCVAFSPDGKLLATGSWRGAVRVWDPTTRQLLLHRGGQSDPIATLAFSPDGRQLAAGNFNRLIEVWDLTTGQLLRTLRGHTQLVLGVAFTHDGRRLASTGTDNTVRLWEASTGQETLLLRDHADFGQCVAFSPDGRLLASASMDQTIRIWDATPLQPHEGEEVLTFREHTDEVWSVAFSPDGRWIASSGMDKTVRVWDATTGQVAWTYGRIPGVVFSVAFSSDSRYLAAAGIDGSGAKNPFVIKFLDAQTGKEAFEVRATREIFGVTFSPDGQRLALASGDGTVSLVNVQPGQKPHVVGRHDREVQSLAFSPDGQHLASVGTEGTLKVWEVIPAQEVLRPPVLTRSGLGPFGVAYSPDGRHLVTGSKDGVLALWDATSVQEIQRRREHIGMVSHVAFSPDGRWVASAGTDCTVKIWDATTLQLLHTFRGHQGYIASLAFAPDRRRLASASRGDHTVKVWDLTRLVAKVPGEQ